MTTKRNITKEELGALIRNLNPDDKKVVLKEPKEGEITLNAIYAKYGVSGKIDFLDKLRRAGYVVKGGTITNEEILKSFNDIENEAGIIFSGFSSRGGPRKEGKQGEEEEQGETPLPAQAAAAAAGGPPPAQAVAAGGPPPAQAVVHPKEDTFVNPKQVLKGKQKARPRQVLDIVDPVKQDTLRKTDVPKMEKMKEKEVKRDIKPFTTKYDNQNTNFNELQQKYLYKDTSKYDMLNKIGGLHL